MGRAHIKIIYCTDGDVVSFLVSPQYYTTERKEGLLDNYLEHWVSQVAPYSLL